MRVRHHEQSLSFGRPPDRERSLRWSKHEVAERWGKLFGQPALVKRWLDGEATEAEQVAAEHLIEGWRRRLIDVSWYMRCLNEHLARRANAEDGCTGRFWEGRFKSQALLDEAGLLTAMAYVDLNPVRAGIAATPEQSEFTSIYARIRQHVDAGIDTPSGSHAVANIPALMNFRDGGTETTTSLPMRFVDYLRLLDWTGRVARADKSGTIRQSLPPILARLHIDPETWRTTMRPGGYCFGRALGNIEALRSHASTLGHGWLKWLHAARALYGDV